MTVPTISRTPKKALAQRATSRTSTTPVRSLHRPRHERQQIPRPKRSFDAKGLSRSYVGEALSNFSLGSISTGRENEPRCNTGFGSDCVCFFAVTSALTVNAPERRRPRSAELKTRRTGPNEPEGLSGDCRSLNGRYCSLLSRPRPYSQSLRHHLSIVHDRPRGVADQT